MLIHSWRWFGPDDDITLDQVKQTGATSIVTALHQVPVGEVWSPEEISNRKSMIRSSGFSWEVAESVPVHEEIKLRTGRYRHYMDNYRLILRNLGREGIGTVCYNFMPALDWTRTQLSVKHSDGCPLRQAEEPGRDPGTGGRYPQVH